MNVPLSKANKTRLSRALCSGLCVGLLVPGAVARPNAAICAWAAQDKSPHDLRILSPKQGAVISRDFHIQIECQELKAKPDRAYLLIKLDNEIIGFFNQGNTARMSYDGTTLKDGLHIIQAVEQTTDHITNVLSAPTKIYIVHHYRVRWPITPFKQNKPHHPVTRYAAILAPVHIISSWVPLMTGPAQRDTTGSARRCTGKTAPALPKG